MSGVDRLNVPEFERPIVELEMKIEGRRMDLADASSDEDRKSIQSEIDELEKDVKKHLDSVFGNLDPWDRVQLSRHPNRPLATDYIATLFDDFQELQGDGNFKDDPAIVTGFATFEGIKCMVMGHRKGRTLQERLRCNFGCAHPEGYRKALRKMKIAQKFKLPIISFINTPGAYPGIEAEERGQSQAIAEAIREMSGLRVPIITLTIGEGGSGGALGIGVGDRYLIMENAYYSVISPEGCAAILWHDAKKAADAARVLRLTPNDLLELGIMDEIVPEPYGGAHRDPRRTYDTVRTHLLKHLKELMALETDELMEKRYQKLRGMGKYIEVAA
ncbi:MAG: acetyl-CoA carboxylase carboxyltransferase subunit alpha [Planctomycetes bacterium]|nr:acetyl-CoA carboxylase carboxyltransferase subunit alpha [Planctomycetota bacterium]MCA8937416.1 acetyl-CoA carboxylase carboxyltransferase subunit alpha [Planctomycetota bacterium]